MSNKKYIYIAEESTTDESITPKWKSMKFLENWVQRIFTPIRKEIEDSFAESLEKMRNENAELRQKVSDLSTELSKLSRQVKEDGEKTKKLSAYYNAEKASSESKYKTAIDILYKLKLKFEQNVPTFGKANKLEVLQMLVKYLYSPTEALKKRILLSSRGDEKAKSILDEIDNFNDNFKSDLVESLSNVNSKWEDCVLFPQETKYNPQTMALFNDMDTEVGEPVYIVSLGYKFPHSNSEKQLPLVFKHKINKI